MVSTALGCFKALARPEISNQALFWVDVPLQIKRLVKEIKLWRHVSSLLSWLLLSS